MRCSVCLDSTFPASTCVCVFIPAGTHATEHAQNAEMKRAETQNAETLQYTRKTLGFINFFFFGRTCTSTSHQPRSFFDSPKKKKKKKKTQTTLHPRTNHQKPYESNQCEKKSNPSNGSSHQLKQLIKRIYPLPINPWFIFLKPSKPSKPINWEDQNSETKTIWIKPM